MKLKDLSIGQHFKVCNGNGKTYEKLSDNGGVLEYNTCRCVDDLKSDQITGLMLISSTHNHRVNKYADVILG